MKRTILVFIVLMIALAGYSQFAEAKKLPSSNDDVSVQELIKILNEKGVLTDAEKAELEKRVKKQTKQNAIQIGGYIQARYTQVKNDDMSLGGDQDDTFGIKRSKLWVKGNVFDDTEFMLQGMYGGANFSLNLLDAALTYKVSEQHKLVVGQYLVPFSLEDLTSDWKIYTINRALVVDKLSPNRDVGVMLNGMTENKVLNYSVGVFNGSGINKNADNGNDNDQYLYAGRFVINPEIEKIKLGIGMNFVSNRLNAGYARVDDAAFAGDEKLLGIDLVLESGATSFIGEYIKAKLEPDAGADVNKDGFYLQLAHYFTPKYQLALKYETYDANTTVKNNKDKQWITVGLNHYIRSNDLRISYNYIFKGEDGVSIDDDTILTQLQVMF